MEQTSHPPPTSTAAAVAVAASAAATAAAATTTSSSSSSTTITTASIHSSLRLLNKASHKISKHSSSSFSKPLIASLIPPIPTVPPAVPNPNPNANPQQPQPPVYNINKNDFRDVVQRLTGSPAHPNPTPQPPPPPIQRPASSRLQKIRPPPLAELAPRPPPFPGVRLPTSPLPPFPAVSAAAESPITAYMRRLRGEAPPAAVGSPLGFGCLPSPGSLAALSPTMLLPTSPVPSPRWRGV